MNRRQFLTGTSALAVSAAMPTVPVLAFNGVPIEFDATSGYVALRQVYFNQRMFWFSGADNIVHFSEPCDPIWFNVKDDK